MEDVERSEQLLPLTLTSKLFDYVDDSVFSQTYKICINIEEAKSNSRSLMSVLIIRITTREKKMCDILIINGSHFLLRYFFFFKKHKLYYKGDSRFFLLFHLAMKICHTHLSH